MDNHQHSITNDITAQRQTLRTSDSAPDRDWREGRKATVFLTTDDPSVQGERATILFLATNAVATLTPSGILAVECDRAAVRAIVLDWSVIGS